MDGHRTLIDILKVKDHRHVEEDDVILRELKIMHQDGTRNVDFLTTFQRTGWTYPVQAQERWHWEVPNKEKFAGDGIYLWMGRHRPLELETIAVDTACA